MNKISEIYDILYKEQNYNSLEATNNENKWEEICRLLSAWKFDTLTDLGCGRGYYLRKFLELGKNVFGVEFSKECCDKYLKDVPHINKDISKYCATGGRCDLVFCMDVLEHIEPKHIDEVLKGTSRLSDRALFGVANHKDEFQGQDLHLIIEDSIWWQQKLSNFYKNVEVSIFSDRFYFFKCSNNLLNI